MPFSTSLNPRLSCRWREEKGIWLAMGVTPLINKRLKNREVKILLKNAKKISGENFVLYPLKNHLSFYRLAISISKKTMRLSSKRNLLRRRIKAVFLQARKEAIIDGGYDMLVVVRQGVFSYQSIAGDIFDLLRKIKWGACIMTVKNPYALIL